MRLKLEEDYNVCAEKLVDEVIEEESVRSDFSGETFPSTSTTNQTPSEPSSLQKYA